MTTLLFLKCLHHFQTHVRATIDISVLSILDYHTTYVNPNAILYCYDKFIIVLILSLQTRYKAITFRSNFFRPIRNTFDHEDIKK